MKSSPPPVIKDLKANFGAIIKSLHKPAKTPHVVAVILTLMLAISVISFQMGRNFGVTESDAKLIPIIERCLDIKLNNSRR